MDYRSLIPRIVERMQEAVRNACCLPFQRGQVIPSITLDRKEAANQSVVFGNALAREANRRLPPVHLYEVRNARVKELFVTKYGMVLSKISCQGNLYPKKRAMLREISTRMNPELVDEAIWVLDKWSHGYFHWLLEALPRLIALEPKVQNKPVLLPDCLIDKTPLESLFRSFGFEVLVYDANQTLCVRKLYSIDFLAPSGSYHPDVLKRLRERFGVAGERSDPAQRIYISRQKSEKRKVKNVEEVRALMDRYAITTYCFEDISFEEQVALLKHASIVVGDHGAGLANLLFAPSDCRVIEIRNRHSIADNFFYTLADAIGQPYYFYEADGSASHPHNSDVQVDVSRLEELLNNCVQSLGK